jgi:hypothetical protein
MEEMRLKTIRTKGKIIQARFQNHIINRKQRLDLCAKTKDPDRHRRNSCKYQIFHPLTTGSCNAYRQPDNFGVSLWWAATNGHQAVAKLLLDKEGVDLNSKNDRVEFFLPVKDIDLNGIVSDIKRYSEPGASVSVRVHHKDGRAGYLIKAHRVVTTAMIANLKAGSTRWREEQAIISRLRSANFHTIQTLYGAEDQRHMAQFKIERFLDKLDNDYPWGSILDAPFNSNSRKHEPTCLPDTRVDVLQKISKWVDGKDERRLFWLNGLPGRGKSTIAQQYLERGRLGASFSFSSGGDVGHAGKFSASITMQLASLNRYICEAVAEWSAITDQSLRDQWRQLILRPLLGLDGNSSPSLVLIAASLL